MSINQKFLFLFCLLIVTEGTASAQTDGFFRSFCKLGFAEKMWVVSHPFIAKKTWRITKEVREVANKMISDSTLDGDADGGQVDAFRHVFWMASLSQQINCRKARRLGIAHEKTNYRDFKKGKSEDKSLPDAKSSEMDLKNNDLGIYLGNKYKSASKDSIITFVKQIVTSGKAWIISKNRKGEPLDIGGSIIAKDKYHGKWENMRCLVKSNISRP